MDGKPPQFTQLMIAFIAMLFAFFLISFILIPNFESDNAKLIFTGIMMGTFTLVIILVFLNVRKRH
jgi:hypothetical protein